MSNNQHIPSFDAHGQLTDEQLNAYMEGRLTPGQQHEVEQWLAEGGMEADALEGLRNAPSGTTRWQVNRLNYQLNKKLHQRKGKRRPVNVQQQTLLAIGIIIALAIIAFVLILKMH